MLTDKKNIFLIGQGATVSALAKKLAASQSVGKIFSTSSTLTPYAESVDIREDDVTGLLKFALENEINLTIPISPKALDADIVTFFQENSQPIFGPSELACKVATHNAFGKKFLYKIHAQIAKFGVFEKLQAAEDYLKSANFPVVIKCNKYNNIDDRLVCATMSLAVQFLDVLYSRNETSVIIEDYTYGDNFTIYYIADGYSALPLTSVRNYKFLQDGDGGLLTNGMGCFAPDYKVSEVLQSRVDNIARNMLTSLEKKGSPYMGIFGIDCTMTGEDKFIVNEIKPFLQDFDAAAVLNLVDEDLLELFMACVDGIFSDEWQEIKTKSVNAVSAVVLSRQANKIINGLECVEDIDNIDFMHVVNAGDSYLTKKGAVFALTRTASTLNRAKSYLREDLENIKFDGMKYRKDILN